MSVINQMNRDLQRRQAADKSLAPVLTSLPWWHGSALYKMVFVLVLVALTLVSGYLLWFAKPAPLSEPALASESDTAIEQASESKLNQSSPTSEPNLSKTGTETAISATSTSQAGAPVSPSPNSAQTIDAQSQAMLAAVTSSDGNRIKVLDAKVVFISDIDTPKSEGEAVVAEAETKTNVDAIGQNNEEMVEEITSQPETFVASSPSATPIIATLAPTAFPIVAPSAAPTAVPILAPTAVPTLTPTSQPTQMPTEPEPIAIVAVPAKQANQSSELPGEQLAALEPTNPPVKVKPTPSGPSSLTIKPSDLSDDELIALYQKQARTAKSKGDLASAQSRLQKALAIDSRHVEVRKELAALHYGRGEYSQAMAVLEQGVALVPSNADFRLMQARIYLAGQQQAQALQVLDAITPAVASNQDFYATKAALAQQLNQDNKALEAYLALARTQPKQGKWWLGLAISQEKLGQREQALRSYQQAELVGGLSLASMDYVKGRIAVLQ